MDTGEKDGALELGRWGEEAGESTTGEREESGAKLVGLLCSPGDEEHL